MIGLRLGADDYVVKPFSPRSSSRASTPCCGAATRPPRSRRRSRSATCRSTPAARRVLRDGDEIALTQREFDLLLYLARHPGQAFSREKLMDAVWQYSFYTDTSTVTVHIRRLRAKIERVPEEPRHVQTVWGVGYRFQP